MARLVALATVVVALAATQAAAQPDPDPVALAEANRLGHLLFAYDQAAWHGTDAATTMLEQDADSLNVRVAGYVVERLPEGWRIAFGTVSADSSSFLVAYEAVLDSTYAVVDTAAHYPSRPEQGFLLTAMRARDAAVARFVPLLQTRHNTAVLPGPDGTLYVYVMPSQPEWDVYIVGADTRYTYDVATGAITDVRTLHEGYQVFDLRENPNALTSGPAHSSGLPVETDVFYSLSRSGTDPDNAAIPNHYLFSDDWVFFVSKDGGLGGTLTRTGFVRVYGRDADGSSR
jgi:hypothetical protein